MAPWHCFLGVCSGFTLIGLYLYNCSRDHIKPNLNSAIKVILSCTGITAACNIAYKILIFPGDLFTPGSFKDRYLFMLVGAFVLIWISVESLYQVFIQAKTKKDASTDPQSKV